MIAEEASPEADATIPVVRFGAEIMAAADAYAAFRDFCLPGFSRFYETQHAG